MLYRSAANFERHILTSDPRLGCEIVCLGLIAFLQKCQGKHECGESSYNVIFVGTCV